MSSTFLITIDGIVFDFHSMNVKRPQLFQVYVDFNGNKMRFHLKDEQGTFVVAMPEQCPREILQYESELSERVKQHYNLI